MSQAPTSPKGPSGAAASTAEADATLYLHPQTLARLGTMELRAKMIVEGVMSGMHRSPHHGYSVEFAQHRPYVPGDDLRHLDWKAYGRLDKLYLKQYEQETNLDLVLLVDTSGSMNYGSRSFAEASGVGQKTSRDGRSNWTKFDHATATAAAFSYMALKQGDRVGLATYADTLRSMVERSSAQGQWRRIVSALSTHPVEQATDFGRVIDQTLAKLNNRCLVCIISDCFEDAAHIHTALARIRHRRHDAIVCQVLDEAEREFGLTQAGPFEGLEGEARITLDPRSIRDEYLAVFNKHQDGVRKAVAKFGFDYQMVDTHSWLGPPLAAFMAKRNAVLKRRSTR